MEVILLERIDRLGQMGDVVKVKNGYARNFLLPQRKAMRATEENKKHFEDQRAQLEANNLEHREEAQKLGKKMDGLSVILVRQAGEAGQLYGSVNTRDIADSVTVAGFTITRQQVNLANPIKALGLYHVTVALHPEVSAHITANVARSEEEAKIQAKTGKAVTSGEEESIKTAPSEPVSETGEEKQKTKKDDEQTQAAEESADEAVIEQAEAIFEEGAAPEATPEDDNSSEDSPGGAPEKAEEEKPE